MTLRTATGSAGSNGTAYTAATAGCTTLVGTGTLTATNANLEPNSTLDFLVNESANLIGLSFTGTSDASGAVEVFVYFLALPSVACVLMDMRSAGASAARIGISATNKFTVTNAVGALINTFANTFAVNTWYRLEVVATPGSTTTNGTINAAYYADNSATAIEAYSSGAVVNAGTAVLTEYRAGKLSASVAVNAQFALFGVNNGATSFIGPYAAAAPPANAIPTVTAGATVTMTSGSTANITATGNDSDGTISSFSATLASTSSSTTPTIGTPVTTNAGTANASTAIPISNLTPGDHKFNVTDTDNSGATSTPAVCRIVYTSLAPRVRSVTLNSVTMTSPTTGTAKDALNAWLANPYNASSNPSGVQAPVFQATTSPPASGAGVIVAYQPLDSASVAPNFGHYWASDGATSLTVYVDLKFGGVTRATQSLTTTSATPVFVGRNATSNENTAIGTDRSLPSVESRFA